MMCRTVTLIIEFKLLNRIEKIYRLYPLIYYRDFCRFWINISKKSIYRNFRYIDPSLFCKYKHQLELRKEKGQNQNVFIASSAFCKIQSILTKVCQYYPEYICLKTVYKYFPPHLRNVSTLPSEI